MTVLAALLVALILGGGIGIILHVTRDPHSTQMAQLASELNADYHKVIALSTPTRQAGFQLIAVGEIHYARHYLSGHTQGEPFTVFEYGLVIHRGAVTQTVIMLNCPATAAGRLYLSPRDWLTTGHPFTEAARANTHETLRYLPSSQTPKGLGDHVLKAENSFALIHLMNNGLAQWINQHPHTSIEWANGLLMLYRPEHLLSAEQIPSALASARSLQSLITTASAPHSP